jgi:hypothetical protein
MTRLILTLTTCLIALSGVFAQPLPQTVYTQDIDNFWTAFDSVQSTKDSSRQLFYIRSLYIDKGTAGLKAFMKVRDYTAEGWVKAINQYPKFWASIRPNTLTVKTKTAEFTKSIARLKKLYPELKDARLYFTIGCLHSGGTTDSNMVLIGAEIATGDSTTDVSEFPNKWLATVFKGQSRANNAPRNNIVPLNIHEYVHTQQQGESDILLPNAIKEGSADFITELTIDRPMQTSYIKYGYEHEQELKEAFKQEMFTTAYQKWLYNGSEATTMADLGYFMGYTICKSYYNHSTNKKAAVKAIIELNYSDSNAVETFLTRSAYYTEPIDKAALIAAFREKQPTLLRLEPFSNGDTLVDPTLKSLSFVFSKPMRPKGYSIEYASGGKEHFPIKGVTGFSADGTTFSVKAELQPGRDYEFVISKRSFASQDGYALQTDYTIKFRTK